MVDQVATAPCTDPIQVRFLLLRMVYKVRSFYFDGRALIGSICDPLLAGKYPATVATTTKTITVPVNDAGSCHFTPNNNEPNDRVRISDPQRPMPSPMAARRSVSSIMRACTLPGDAPSAV